MATSAGGCDARVGRSLSRESFLRNTTDPSGAAPCCSERGRGSTGRGHSGSQGGRREVPGLTSTCGLAIDPTQAKWVDGWLHNIPPSLPNATFEELG